MRQYVPIFKILLWIWIISDFAQAMCPNVPPDPTEHKIVTNHIFFHQVSQYACILCNGMLLYVLYHDRDAGEVAVQAGIWTWLIYVASMIFYTVNLFEGKPRKSTPMGWALVVEVSFLMFNIGLALPPRIIAVPSKLGGKRMPRFLREGKVRENEDTSGRKGAKPMLLSGPEVPDMDLDKSDATQEDRLQRQRDELSALNKEMREGKKDPLTAFHGADVFFTESAKATPSASLEELEALKKDAIAREDFFAAQKYKSDIDKLQAKTRVVEACKICGTEYQPGSAFCGKCGGTRGQEKTPHTSMAEAEFGDVAAP